MDKNKDFLPIGTIVTINEGDQKFMITGYLPVLEKEKVIYDYCGCFYPEGYLNAKTNSLFNKNDINTIIFMGPKDDLEYINFATKLNILSDEIEKHLSNSNKDEEEIPFINI